MRIAATLIFLKAVAIDVGRCRTQAAIRALTVEQAPYMAAVGISQYRHHYDSYSFVQQSVVPSTRIVLC